MRGSKTYTRLRARHERLWRQLAKTERDLVKLVVRASGTADGASMAHNESLDSANRIAGWFPETLREAVYSARETDRNPPHLTPDPETKP